MRFKIITSGQNKKLEIEKDGKIIIISESDKGFIKVENKNMQLVNLKDKSFEIVLLED